MVRVFDSIFWRKRRPYGCVGYAGSPATLRNQAVDCGVLAVFVAVVTICFVSAALRHRLNRPPFAEEAAIAIHLANGDGFSSPYDASHRAPPTSISAPVYPLIMAAAYRLGGISHVVLLLLAINAVCFGVIVCGVFHLGRYYVSPVSGWMAGMLFGRPSCLAVLRHGLVQAVKVFGHVMGIKLPPIARSVAAQKLAGRLLGAGQSIPERRASQRFDRREIGLPRADSFRGCSGDKWPFVTVRRWLALRFGPRENLVGGVENALGRTSPMAWPGPATGYSPDYIPRLEAQRFAAKQRHGLGFNLANISGCGFGVGKVALIAMAKGNMSQLMEKGFGWLHGNRADGDFPATLFITLGVAIQVLKGDSLDFQRGKCRLVVEASLPSVPL